MISKAIDGETGIFRADVGINLSGLDTYMSQEFLDHPEVCVFQEPGCKGMPQNMWSDGSTDGVDRKVFYYALKITI